MSQDQEEREPGLTLDSFAVATGSEFKTLTDYILDAAGIPDDAIVDELHVDISVTIVIEGEQQELDLNIWARDLPDLNTDDLG